MYNLILINENYINGYRDEILDIIYIYVVICGIFIILVKNPVISVLFLIGLFSGIASYLIILGLSFIGLSYLIVYIGAVSILFLFILMLINVRISEIQNNTSNSIPLVFLTLLLFSNPLLQLSPYSINYTKNNNFLISPEIFWNKLSFVTSKTWDGNIIEYNHITSIGNIIYTNYNIWLIIVSFVLLLAMTGTIVITIKQKH